MRVGRARRPAARRSVARGYATLRSAARRAGTPRSARRSRARRAAAGTPLADDSSSSFHTPAAGATPAATPEEALL